MAQSKPVKDTDVIESNLFGDTKKSAEELLLTLTDLSAGFKKINKESTDYLKANRDPKTAAELKKTTKALDEANKSRKAAIEVDKQAAKVKKVLSDQEIKDAAVTKSIEKQRQDSLRATAILESKQIGLEAKLLAQNTLLRLERARLTGAEADYAAQLLRINSSLDANNALIKENSDKQKQQTLNVGNYSDSIQDALNKTGVFGDVIGKVTAFVELYGQSKKKATRATASAALATEAEAATHIQNLAAVQAETIATEKLSFAKKALNAITSPLGLLAIAAAALIAVLNAVADASQRVQDEIALAKAELKDFTFQTGSAFKNLTLEIIKFRDQSRILELQLLSLKDVEGDLTEISNDETLSLGKRRKAFEDASNARVKAAEKEVEIQTRKKALIDQEIAAYESSPFLSKGKAIADLYDKQKDAAKDLFIANDNLGDLDRTNAQEARKRTQGELIDQIELLRSKKLGADAEIGILTKKFNDEKSQLEERDVFNQQLRAAELAAQEEEFRLFQKGVKAKIDFQALVKTTDSVDLARQLKELADKELSVALSDELAKIIKQAQDNEALYDERVAKNDNERIQRLKTIAQIQQDIAKMQRDRDLSDLEERQKDAQLEQSKRMNDIMVAERVFNSEKSKAVKDAGENELKLQGEVTQKKLDNLELDTQEAKRAAIETINDEKIRNAELIKIQEKFLLDKNKIEADAEGENLALAERNAKAKAAIDLKQTTITLQELGKVGAAFEDELNKRDDIQAKQADRQIQKTQDTLSRQRDLAEKGLDNELAFQEEKLAKQELAKQDSEERKARQKEILDMVQQYNAFLITRLNQPDANPNTAAALALSDTLLAKGIAKGLVQFAADGNDDVQGAGTTTSDSIPFMLSKHEGVVKASANMENKGVVKALNKGTFDKMYLPKAQFEQSAKEIRKSTAEQIYASLAIQHQVETNTLLKKIAEKPVPNFDVDKLGNLVTTVSKQGRKTITTHRLGK